MSAASETLARAATLMEESLTESTGLKDLPRKVVTYWTLSTHSLRNVNTYPILCLLGKMATGKSQTLAIIENFARCPANGQYLRHLAEDVLPGILESATGQK